MKINYDSDLINIKRLIDDQDTNELLNLTEYILAIVVRGEKQEEMIDRIFKLSENAQEDLQQLMLKYLKQGDDEISHNESISEDPMFRAQV